MIAGLKKVDSVALYKINDPVLLGDTPRPDARGEVLQGLRFAYSCEWVPQNRDGQV